MTFVRRLPRALALFALMVLFAELLLWPFHLERFDAEFGGRPSFPVFRPGEGDLADYYVTNPHFRGALNFQKFRRRKEAGVFRVFVLGGSAAYGWPGDESDSFTGYLRRSLDAVAPARFEVVNAAGMSYGSHRVLDLLGDVVRHQPDLVIVYSGNNEYVERNVLTSGERRGGFAYALRDRLSRTNVYRGLRLAISRAPVLRGLLARRGEGDITDVRAIPTVARGRLQQSARTNQEVLRAFRDNLSRMVRLLEENSVRSVFCSVPVNLGTWPPSEPSLRFADRGEMLAWAAKARRARALVAGDPVRAARLFEDLLRAKPEWAPGAFERGRALEAQGDYEGALGMFRAARDRDPRPLRALGIFNETVRASAAAGRGARFLDLEALFRDGSPHGITGDALVRDYCHPTEAGHRLIATALLPLVLGAAGREDLEGPAARAIAVDAPRAKDPRRRAGELYAMGMTYSFAGRPRDAEKVYREVLRLDPRHVAAMNNLGNILLERHRLAEARDLFGRALALEPSHIRANYGMGLLRYEEGDIPGAEAMMRKVLELNPQFPAALVILGDIAQRRGAFPEAIGLYRKALSQGFEDSHTHLMTAKALLATGDRSGAAGELARALEFDPADDEAARLAQSLR